MRRERIASVVTALALVLAAVGGGLGPASVTQTASAEWSDECSFASSLIGAAYNTVIGADEGCRWIAGDSTDYENITKTDAYSNLVGLKDSANSYTTTVSNFQENSRSVAYTKGKIAVVRALENQSTVGQAKLKANESVRDYYAQQESDVIRDYNAKLTQFFYAVNSSQIDGTLQGVEYEGTESSQIGLPDDISLQQENYTLVNGTTVKINTIVANGSNGDITYRLTESYVGNATVDDPTTETVVNTERVILNPTWYKTLLSEIETQEQQVVDNMDQYADGVFSQYESGQLNATTLYQNDPSLLASEATTSYNSTGYYGYASAQLASLGYAGDLNQSHVVEVGGANYTGTLFFSGEDGRTFSTGETYDFENVSGSVYMAVSDGPNNQTGIVRLDDKGSSFTILEARNTQTNEVVNSTTPQAYIYDSANATALQSEIDRLEELRDFYQEQSSASGGVGINLGTEDKAIIGVIAAVVLVLALRD